MRSKKKFLIILTFLFGILSYISCSVLNGGLNYKSLIFYEGKGLNEMRLDTLTIENVIKELGNNYKIVEWGNYSYEYHYPKIGISFWFKQADRNKRIISISAYSDKFFGKTSSGLRFSKNTTLKDIIIVYGNPKWEYPKDDDVVDAEYEDIGIYFSFKKVMEEKDVPLNKETEIYLNKNPVELVIGRIGTAY